MSMAQGCRNDFRHGGGGEFAALRGGGGPRSEKLET